MNELPAALLAELEAGVGLERLAELAKVPLEDARQAEALGLLPNEVKGGEKSFRLPAYRALQTAGRLESPDRAALVRSLHDQVRRLQQLRDSLATARERVGGLATGLQGVRDGLKSDGVRVKSAAEIQAEREAVEDLRARNERRANELVGRADALRSAANYRRVTTIAKVAVARSKAKKRAS
ncbi:MAG TPA: hypothetical protein VNT60_09320 [Deinococcales bacterium]|nr:hypothetical protein [Deinococcales bacterium]